MNKTLAPAPVVVSVQTDPQPVAFGGDLTLALGLEESLKLLNDYQIATNGLWLDMQQGEVD